LNYAEWTPESKRIFQRAKKVLPAGVTYSLRAIHPHPFYVRKADGVKLFDVDDNVYTDYWVGHGALILGHSPRTVIKAVSNQLENGTHFGFCHELEIELAERIVDMMPCAEMVRYTNSGTEANLYGTRLARAYTDKMKMVKIEGGWHGGYDSLHFAVHYPFDVSESAGLNPKTTQDTTVVPFNDLEAAEKVLKPRDKACLIIEPVLAAAGFLTPEEGYLEGLREICDDTDTLLIFDEVVTGFRLAKGGAQEYYGVTPDISIIGKILGGGFPIGAFCGRKEIFDFIDHNMYREMEKRSAHGGTFVGNPISTTAGIATLDILKHSKTYEKINNLGKKMRNNLKDIIDRNKLKGSVTGIGSTFALHFLEKPPINAREMAKGDLKVSNAYYHHMLERKIAFMSPAISHCFICEPHKKIEIEKFLNATEEFFAIYI
jgi:glutamate-1-semialdehyde 2,1-aminomutase